jgi:hypothetical protein
MDVISDLLGNGVQVGQSRACFILVYFANIFVLLLICRLAARDQTEFGEVVYGGIAIQFCEIILSGTVGRFSGKVAIVTIFLATVFVLTRLCGLSLRRASEVGLIYYTWRIGSFLLLGIVDRRMK